MNAPQDLWDLMKRPPTRLCETAPNAPVTLAIDGFPTVSSNFWMSIFVTYIATLLWAYRRCNVYVGAGRSRFAYCVSFAKPVLRQYRNNAGFLEIKGCTCASFRSIKFVSNWPHQLARFVARIQCDTGLQISFDFTILSHNLLERIIYQPNYFVSKFLYTHCQRLVWETTSMVASGWSSLAIGHHRNRHRTTAIALSANWHSAVPAMAGWAWTWTRISP